MKLKSGTVMIDAPKSGAPKSECFVCTGPETTGREAFLAGMVVGVRSMVTGSRPERLCVDHETQFREALTVVCPDPDALRRLGIGFKIA